MFAVVPSSLVVAFKTLESPSKLPLDSQLRTPTRIDEAMDSTDFKTHAQSLFKDGTLSDYSVKCGGSTYQVHRVFVATHSEYFRALFRGDYEASLIISTCIHQLVLTYKQENHGNSIELKEDNPAAVKLMIDYFYGFDYDDTYENITAFNNILELNAAVYVTADKYGVPDLKDLAVEHFKKAARASAARGEDPKEAIRLAFTGTPPTDRDLRDVVLDYWKALASKPVNQGPHIAFMIAQEVPEFAAEALQTLAMPSKLYYTARCADKGVNTRWANDYDEIFHHLCFFCRRLIIEHPTFQITHKDDSWKLFWPDKVRK